MIWWNFDDLVKTQLELSDQREKAYILEKKRIYPTEDRETLWWEKYAEVML